MIAEDSSPAPIAALAMVLAISIAACSTACPGKSAAGGPNQKLGQFAGNSHLGSSLEAFQPFSAAGTVARSSTQANAERRQIWRCGEKLERWAIVPARNP